MFKKASLALALVAGLCAYATAAPIEVSEVVLTASTTATNSEGTVRSSLDQLDSPMDTSVFAQSSFFGNVFFEDERPSIEARAFANTDGEFSTDVSVFTAGSASATVKQTYTVTNTTNQDLNVFFDFRIESGSLSTTCEDDILIAEGNAPVALNIEPPFNDQPVTPIQRPSCSDYNQSAFYLAEILSGSNTIFSSFTGLDSMSGVQSETVQEGYRLAEDNDLLDGLFSWDEKTITDQNLGIVGAGESIELVYQVQLDGSTLFTNNSFNEPEFVFLDFNSGGLFSDPFGFRADLINNIRTQVVNADPVNAPATLGLVGLSLFGMALRARRNNKSA